MLLSPWINHGLFIYEFAPDSVQMGADGCKWVQEHVLMHRAVVAFVRYHIEIWSVLLV